MRSINERTGNESAALKEAIKTVSKEMRVAIPGIVQAWDSKTQTVSVRCAIREKVTTNGTRQEMEIPLLVDVPVIFPSAGGYSFLAKPKKGDECLVIFADMCIDSWWQSGGVQSQMESRRHDLSDGFAIMGCWSQPNRKENFPTSGCVIQNEDGTAGISIKGKVVNLFGTVKVNGNSI